MTLENSQKKFFDNNKSILAYWQTIKSVPVPTVEEELVLVERAKNGDESARERLSVGNQRIIFSIAKQYAKTSNEIIDYVNEGTMGLLQAIDTYDSTRGFRFITYASYYIRRQMNLYATYGSQILYSGNKGRYQPKLKEIRQAYFNENGFYPSSNTICAIFKEKYNIDVKSVQDLYDIVVDDIVFENEDASTNTGREKEFNNATYSVNEYDTECDKDYLKSLISSSYTSLNKKEKDVIQMLFGVGSYSSPHTTDCIAEKYNVTVQCINAIKKKALEKMRKTLSYKLAI